MNTASTKQPEIQELISRLCITNSNNNDTLHSIKEKLRSLHYYQSPPLPVQSMDKKMEEPRDMTALDNLSIAVSAVEQMGEFIKDIHQHLSQIV